MNPDIRKLLARGLVIPACPLALTATRKLDERRQRGLFRYYIAAGAGGVAVGVHTTQFGIREPKIGLFKPVLELAAAELRGRDLARIAGVCGRTKQALREAALIGELGYDAALLSLGALQTESEDELLSHCRAVGEIIPIIGFYFQPAVGGRVLPFSFWRRFAEIENVVAIKIAPFNRYQTIDVLRAVAEAGRDDISLYTGNDDNILLDLLTPFRFAGPNGKTVERRIVGGLLGQWAVWTHTAAQLLDECHRVVAKDATIPSELLRRNIELTDANAAIFDAANGFRGCIPGIHEVLRRQGLLAGTWCLDPNETLSKGQAKEIDRVCRAYPHLTDDAFVEARREEWLKG